jgi:hypothetical protein
MSLYTEAPGIYCNGDGCCKTYEVGTHWEHVLDGEWTCPNDHVLKLTDEYAVRHWSWRIVESAPAPGADAKEKST